MISNVYLEESKGYLLLHLTRHPHIPRDWIRTTQYRSYGNKLRNCIEINVAHLSNKSCREGLVASDLQEKTMRSKTKVKHNGGKKTPLTPRRCQDFFQRDLYAGRCCSMVWHASIRAARRRVCMGSIFSRVWINRGKNTARRQLNREKYTLPFPRSRLRIWFRETGSTVPSCASLLILHAQAKSGSYSRDSSRFPRRRPHIPSTANEL